MLPFGYCFQLWSCPKCHINERQLYQQLGIVLSRFFLKPEACIFKQAGYELGKRSIGEPLAQFVLNVYS